MKNQIIKYLEKLDSVTFRHSVRVMMIAAEIEEYLCCTNHKLMCAALLHDIGKMYMPGTILDKNASLTSLEREIIDLHSYIGYSLLTDLNVDEDICRIVLYHHGFNPLVIRKTGKYDCKKIYREAFILRTIDSYEALTSDRPYHRGVSSKEAINILLRENNYEKDAIEYLITAAENESLTSAVKRNTNDLSLDNVEKLLMTMDLGNKVLLTPNLGEKAKDVSKKALERLIS